VKIIIPLQMCSTRIKHKNVRPFFRNDSLFDIKAKQILAFEDPHNVYVSSENPIVREFADRYGFHFMLRDPALTGNKVFQPDLVRALTDPLPGEDDIMWIQVTSPLFNEFVSAKQKWNEVREAHDSLVVVKPFRGHLLDAEGNPANFAFGYWHKVSQNLPRQYQILWSLFILKRETVRKFHYHIGVKPFLFEARGFTIDIDYQQDFELAQLLYEKLHGLTHEDFSPAEMPARNSA
jgi:CMP-N-acetylneuraminic acid synthetase